MSAYVSFPKPYYKNLVVYVLACANNTYYVGKIKAQLLEKRLLAHFSGKGAVFTKQYKPEYVCMIEEHCGYGREFEVWSKFAAVWGHQNVGGYDRWLCSKLNLPWNI